MHDAAAAARGEADHGTGNTKTAEGEFVTCPGQMGMSKQRPSNCGTRS